MDAQKGWKYLVSLMDGRSQCVAGYPIVAPQQSADEHEERPHWNAEKRTDRNTAKSFTVSAGDEVSLHQRLVRRVFLQIEEKPVEGENKDRGLCQRWRETAQT